jgi:adhesin transport system outer membrane protein
MMNTIKTSRRLLSVLIGSLAALESSGLHADSYDELLTFVAVSKPEVKASATAQPVSSTALSANEMAKKLAQQSKNSAVSIPVSRPALSTQTTPRQVLVQVPPVSAAASATAANSPVFAPKKGEAELRPSTFSAKPLLQNPEVTTSATPNKPLLATTVETQAPAPIRQAAAPTRVTPRSEAPVLLGSSATVSNEIPVFRPASSLPVTPQREEPTLTRGPALSVAATPITVARVSPGEMELRGIFFRAVMTALDRSPQLRSSQLQIDAAKEDVSNAKGQRWPQVDVTSNSRRYEFGKGNRNASDSNMPAFGVNVATNLIDFGQTSNTIKSKEFSVTAANFQNTAQTEDLAWRVSSGLVELSKQRLIIEMSKQYVARMQELVTMLSGIVSADQGRRSELTQATGRFLQAQSALDNAVSKARDTEIQLYRLIGETQVPLPPAMQWQLQPSQLDRLLALVDQHPTLRQAQAQSQAAFAEADALKSSSLPKINWVVSKDTGKDYYGREQSWQTGINVSWGLFRGGSARAAEQAAVQRAAAMREESEEQRDDLQQRVRAADQDARSMLQRADLYRNLTRESDRIRLDFFDQWYHLGKRTLLDVLSAESDYYNNRVAEVTNRFDGYSAIFRGYASAGQLVNWLNNKPGTQ